MKTSKRQLKEQRGLIDKKLLHWLPLRSDKRPPSGWIKAIRGALGLNARQLSNLLGVDHSSVVRLEERERQGKISIELLERAAHAMECKLIYAVVPKDTCESLDAIIEDKAKQAAEEIVMRVEQSMRLEQQGADDLKYEIEKLASDLKKKMDARIWASKTASKNKKDTP